MSAHEELSPLERLLQVMTDQAQAQRLLTVAMAQQTDATNRQAAALELQAAALTALAAALASDEDLDDQDPTSTVDTYLDGSPVRG